MKLKEEILNLYKDNKNIKITSNVKGSEKLVKLNEILKQSFINKDDVKLDVEYKNFEPLITIVITNSNKTI